jgi:predicted DNA binding CopG/RHH family protein
LLFVVVVNSSREYKDFQSNKTKYSEMTAKNKEYFAQLNEAEDFDGQKLENTKSLESDAHFDFRKHSF